MTPEPLSVDPTLLASWLQIRDDNTIAIWTGSGEFGQNAVTTGFRQVVAEELRVSFEAIAELVISDTDRTPDGGGSAGYMSKVIQEVFGDGVGLHPDSPFGQRALSLQKVAAYTYRALLERASEVLGASVETLTAADGVVRSQSRSVTYAELVREKPLDVLLDVIGAKDGLGLYVLGTPPLVPISEYRVIGTSCPSPLIPPIVRGAASGIGDVRLPGMLHGRMIHPKTFGSTLVSAGHLDHDEYPDVQIVVRQNLVAVVGPDEWDAERAARALTETTVWSDWRGLPRSEDLVEAMIETDWSEVPDVESSPDRAPLDEALAKSPRMLNAFYALPFFKHAPMGPEVVVADARSDGTVHIWAATQHPSKLKRKLATMLEVEPDNVIIRFAQGAGTFGRTTGGDTGPEAEAVILSQACKRPVRLQWSREDDFAWSTQHAPYLGDVSVALGDAGEMDAFLAEHHMPGTMEDPLLGALLAGLPIEPHHGSHLATNWIEWPYDRVANHVEVAKGAATVGQADSPLNVGLRHRSMRSPVHLHQNFAVESMVNEAAAAAGADPIQFRIEHTTDGRLIDVLEIVREMSSWEARPSPAPSARALGDGLVHGRGVGVAIRHGGYFAGVVEITVDLETGRLAVDRYWLAADVGVIVNPMLLRLNLEGGSAMGISQALHEELQFNGSAITSTDFRSYPILKMTEMPEIHVEVIDRRDVKVVGQAAEPPNMVPPVALAGAFFDATGKYMRRLPFRPEYVRAELLERL